MSDIPARILREAKSREFLNLINSNKTTTKFRSQYEHMMNNKR